MHSQTGDDPDNNILVPIFLAGAHGAEALLWGDVDDAPSCAYSCLRNRNSLPISQAARRTGKAKRSP